jgi:hypothetical protein
MIERFIFVDLKVYGLVSTNVSGLSAGISPLRRPEQKPMKN